MLVTAKRWRRSRRGCGRSRRISGTISQFKDADGNATTGLQRVFALTAAECPLVGLSGRLPRHPNRMADPNS